MPDIQTAVPAAPAGPPPALHPMDPRRGEQLSPLFAAFPRLAARSGSHD